MCSSESNFSLMDLSSKLTDSIENKNWNHALEILKPKLFCADESVSQDDVEILIRLGIVLTRENDEIPQQIRIQCLKCLGNSLGRKSLDSIKSHNLIDRVYSAVADWAVDYIITNDFGSKKLLEDQIEILRLSTQFLCNLITFMNTLSLKHQEIENCLDNDHLKNTLIKLIQAENISMINVSCAFVHNVLLNLNQKYFAIEQSIGLCIILLKPIKMGFNSAKEIFFHILKELNIIKDIYDKLSMEEKLCLWEIIFCEHFYEDKHKSVDILSCDTMEFITHIFCEKSDLILKTVDTYSVDMEPKEIIILLDILGILTSETFKKYETLNNHKNLLINCTYLLKSIHSVGKESNNFVTPIQKLSEIAPSARANSNDKVDDSKGKNLEDHPAYGFKAGLVRVIGNMSYKNKICQDVLRDIDAIPLLLDCCNIDARNPLITQWVILALRNLCEENLPNQKIIENSAKIGSIDTSTLQEMGLNLNEDQDGRIIGVVPLNPDLHCKK